MTTLLLVLGALLLAVVGCAAVDSTPSPTPLNRVR
jgi:hypothetical protein